LKIITHTEKVYQKLTNEKEFRENKNEKMSGTT
jgi:hypothetical protein